MDDHLSAKVAFRPTSKHIICREKKSDNMPLHQRLVSVINAPLSKSVKKAEQISMNALKVMFNFVFALTKK